MKRVLLTLAAVTVAASPILAAAEPEHKEAPRPEAVHRAEPARPAGVHPGEGRPGAGLHHEEAVRADHAGAGLRHEEAVRADHAGAGLRHEEAVRAGDHRQVFNRANPNWWRGRPEFRGYAGARPGFWFVPGLGYRGVPAAYWGYNWGVGLVVPGLFFGNSLYYLNNPWIYGLDPAPYGFRWMYLGPNLALVNPYGRIVRVVPHVF